MAYLGMTRQVCGNVAGPKMRAMTMVTNGVSGKWPRIERTGR